MKRPKPPASLVPHECVILAIDPGAKAGAAILVRGRVTFVIPVKPGGEAEVVRLALGTATRVDLPLVVVGEKWTTGGRRQGEGTHGHINMLVGLGVAWGRWDLALRDACVPRSKVVRVLPRTWQSKVLDGRVLKRKRAEERAIAVAEAAGAANVDGSPLTPDQAAAVCIGLWGAKAGEVAAAMPKPRTSRAPRARKGASAA